MELNILTWNINFINNCWKKRIKCINKLIKKRNDYDIIALQEVTIPFNEDIKNIYTFVNDMDYKYDTFFARKIIYKWLNYCFPKKEIIKNIFNYMMDKLLIIISFIMSIFGNKLANFFINYGFIGKIVTGFFVLLFPFIFIFAWSFFGMLTLIKKNKIKANIIKKEIFNGRSIQYSEFKYNSRDILFINVHLSYKNEKKQKKDELKKLLNFIKNKKKDIVLIAGDLNFEENTKMYKILKKNKYKSLMCEKFGIEKKTYPSRKPKKCLDYIWVYGDNIKIKNINLVGSKKHSDHLGIEATIIINKKYQVTKKKV